VSRTASLLTIALAILSWTSGIGDGGSVALGGAFQVASLQLIRMQISRLMRAPEAGGHISLALAARFPLLLAALVFALTRLPIDALSFFVGNGALFAAIVLEAVWLGEPAAESAGQSGDDGALQ
jgi:hypothetical protein